jgi:recombination protein RecR
MRKDLEKFNALVDAFCELPTVGKKSALRFAYHLVQKDRFLALRIAHSIENAIASIQECQKCGSISEDEICSICLDEMRDESKLCIVESVKDIFIIEDGSGFEGYYFVLNSLDEESIEKLKNRIREGVREIIFAFTPSIQSDGVILILEDRLKEFDLVFTKIAQGVPTGVSLENIDTLSVAKAIEKRTKI